MIDNQEPNQSESIKLYSQRAITIATYFGGPIAAGILARQNFINLGKEQLGKGALYIGIVSTILLFVGIFSIPDNIMSKIPNMLIPLVYTGIIYLIIEKYQGEALNEHKAMKLPFYSAWKATGIGAICMVLLVGGILGVVYLMPGDFDTTKYDNGIAQFKKNEVKALELFTILEKEGSDKALVFINNVGIPTWSQNATIIEDIDKIDGLYEQFKKQDLILKKYSMLRIESYKLIRRAIIENTSQYDSQIADLNAKIDNLLKLL